jgi:hypothetical protein
MCSGHPSHTERCTLHDARLSLGVLDELLNGGQRVTCENRGEKFKRQTATWPWTVVMETQQHGHVQIPSGIQLSTWASTYLGR